MSSPREPFSFTRQCEHVKKEVRIDGIAVHLLDSSGIAAIARVPKKCNELTNKNPLCPKAQSSWDGYYPDSCFLKQE